MQQLKISARWKIHEGKFEEFRSIAKECLATVMLKSPNRRHYDWYFNDELRECIVLEKYADSDALLSHISVVGDYLGRFMAIADFNAEIYGNPSQALLDAITPLDKKIYYFYQGFKEPEAQLASLT